MDPTRPLLPKAKFAITVGATGFDPATVKINGVALGPLTSIDMHIAAEKQTVLTLGFVPGSIAVAGEGRIDVVDHLPLLMTLIDYVWTAGLFNPNGRMEELRTRIEDAGLAPTVLS